MTDAAFSAFFAARAGDRCEHRSSTAGWPVRRRPRRRPATCTRPVRPSITPRSARSRTISSAKKGFPAARATTRSTSVASDGSAPDEFGGQCRCVRITQRTQRDGLCAWYATQHTAVLRSIGDQHQRRRLRSDRHEVGQHRFTRRVDPVRVLDDDDRRFPSSEGGAIDKCRQAPAPGIGPDVGRGDRGITDAEQVVDQQQIFRVGLRQSGSNACSGLVGAQTLDAGGGPHQPCDHVEWDVGGVGFAVRGEHRDTATGRARRGFADESALADSRRAHEA